MMNANIHTQCVSHTVLHYVCRLILELFKDQRCVGVSIYIMCSKRHVLKTDAASVMLFKQIVWLMVWFEQIVSTTSSCLTSCVFQGMYYLCSNAHVCHVCYAAVQHNTHDVMMSCLNFNSYKLWCIKILTLRSPLSWRPTAGRQLSNFSGLQSPESGLRTVGHVHLQVYQQCPSRLYCVWLSTLKVWLP